MSTLTKLQKSSPSVPSRHDIELARVAQRCLMEVLDRPRATKIKLVSEAGDIPAVELPSASLALISRVLGLMSEGKVVTLMPEKHEFTTVEAANFLNVSRPYVIKEIQEGRIPCRMVGSHRRILFSDLVQYDKGMHAGRDEALVQLSQLSAELGGY